MCVCVCVCVCLCLCVCGSVYLSGLGGRGFFGYVKVIGILGRF